MTIFESLSVVGLFTGPVAAVIITLWAQRRLQRVDGRLALARSLPISQVDHANHTWSANIRQIPAEFRHYSAVMNAWRAYIDVVAVPPSADQRIAQDKKFADRKLNLLFEICKATRLGLSESDIRNSAYVAQGYTDRQRLAENAARALVRIADASEKAGQS